MLWTIWVNAAAMRCLPSRRRTRQARAGASSSRRRQASRSPCRLPGHSRAPRSLPRACSVASRAKPFDGVTLQFAKAPFGNDEKDVIAKLLKPFEEQDGDQGRPHGRPVERRGRDLRHELRRAEPVRRQLPDEHRPDGPRNEGRARGAELEELARRPVVQGDEGQVHPEHHHEEHCTRASSTACRASSAARSSTTTRTCSRRPA